MHSQRLLHETQAIISPFESVSFFFYICVMHKHNYNIIPYYLYVCMLECVVCMIFFSWNYFKSIKNQHSKSVSSFFKIITEKLYNQSIKTRYLMLVPIIDQYKYFLNNTIEVGIFKILIYMFSRKIMLLNTYCNNNIYSFRTK